MKRDNERGFALLLVFMLAAAIAISLYKAMPRAAFESERNKEQLLIERGEQYTRAIQLFVSKYKRFPANMDELEKTNNIRFLRKKFVDPMTGKDEWRLLHVNALGILIDSKIKKKDQKGAAAQVDYISLSPTLDQGTANNNNGAANLAMRRRTSDGPVPGQPVDPNAPPPPYDPNNPTGQVPGQLNGVLPNTAQASQPYPGQPYPGQTQQGYTPGYGQSPQGQQGQQAQQQTYPVNPAMPDGRSQGIVGGGINGGFSNSGSGNSGFGSSGFGSSGFGSSGFGNNSSSGNQMGGLGGQQGAQQGGQNNAMNLIQGLLTSPSQMGPQGNTGTAGAITAGGIAGVASKFEGDSIKIYNDRQKYQEWEFVYDMKNDKRLQQAIPGAGAAAVNPGNTQSGSMSQTGGFGGGQQSGFGQSSFGQSSFGQQTSGGFGSQTGGGFGSQSGAFGGQQTSATGNQSGSSSGGGGGNISIAPSLGSTPVQPAKPTPVPQPQPQPVTPGAQPLPTQTSPNLPAPVTPPSTTAPGTTPPPATTPPQQD